MSFLKYGIVFYLLVSCACSYCRAQDTTASAQQEETPKKKEKNPQNVLANKAALMSAIVPGMGQVYNKKYWKPPIIYIGAGFVTYFIIVNNQDLKTFGEAYKARTDNNPDTRDDFENTYTADQLKLLRDDARRYRDMSVVFGAALYALNIIDAYVDRHLMQFDVSDDLSLKVKPFLYTVNNRQFASGLSLNFSLKK